MTRLFVNDMPAGAVENMRVTGDKLADLLQKKGVSSLEELPIEVASDLIKRIKEYEERNDK